MDVHNNDNTGERFNQDVENIYENKATQVDTENFGQEEKTMIQDILHLMKDKCGIEIRGFNKIDRCVLAEWSRQRNCIFKHIRTENININILLKAVIADVGKRLALQLVKVKIKSNRSPGGKEGLKNP